MKERPIIFNGEMVRAILEGRKTQTRRPIKPQPNVPNGSYLKVMRYDGTVWGRGPEEDKDAPLQELWHSKERGALKCPFGKFGDRLWVRETFGECRKVHGIPDDRPYMVPDPYKSAADFVIWRADGEIEWADEDDSFTEKSYWKPSIHMPRWASRITLEITNIRVERVQDISICDAKSEGFKDKLMDGGRGNAWMDSFALGSFKETWDSIYKNWDENPWVWVVEFERVGK